MDVRIVDDYCIVQPEGPLKEADFARIAAAIDPVIEADGELDGLIIHTKGFPGWESFSDMVAHFRFVRGHHEKIEKVALVTDAPVGELAPKIAKHFVAAEIQHFDFDDLNAAIDWVS